MNSASTLMKWMAAIGALVSAALFTPLLLPKSSVDTGSVQEACGLPLEERCVQGRCVYLTEAPSLNSLWGWGELAWQRPWFVGSVAVRELGMRRTSCPAAIEQAGLEVRMVPVEGSELWCAGTEDVPQLCSSVTEHDFSRSRRLRF